MKIRIPSLADMIRIGGRALFGRDFDEFVYRLAERVHIGFRYDFEHFRGGRQIDRFAADNLLPYESLHHIINGIWRAGTVYPAWFMGIFGTNYTPVLGDTMATFPAAATEITAYTSATRPQVTLAVPTNGATDNSAAKCNFTLNHGGGGTVNIWGGFLSNNSAKSSATNVLGSAAQINNAPRALYADDQLLVTLNLNLSNL